MPIHTYNNGQPYLAARGRKSNKPMVEDRRSTCHSIVRGRPTTEEFLRLVERELKIRAYRVTTIKTYISNVRNFLR